MDISPVPRVVVRPSSGWIPINFRDLWVYRELLFFIAWRDLKVRYKQTVLGVAWVLFQPLIAMLIYTVLFGYLLRAPSAGIPYPIFAYAGLLPWNYFANSLNRSSTSIINNTNLITKVFFPRLVIPIAGVLSPLVDFIIAFLILLCMMVFYHMTPTICTFTLPIFLLLAVLTALGFGLWLSALNVRYRDVNYLVPFLIQIWMYLTPVIYDVSLIPERFRWLLALNPMTGVVVGFRWALFGAEMNDPNIPTELFTVTILITLLVLITGVIFFRNTEKSFADII